MESQDFMFELVQHFINRKRIKEQLLQKNIQTLQNPPQIMSDIVDRVEEKQDKFMYGIIKKELSDHYQDFRFLAKGQQGIVILAKEKQTNKRFAIKAYSVRDDQGKVEDEDQITDAYQEIQALSVCRGSVYIANLIKSIDVKQNQFLYLILTEYQGTLQEIIDSTGDKKLNELSAIKYSKEIAEGLLHIHNKKYLVNDLKMENILIDYRGNAIVSDFGLAQKLKKYSQYAYQENLGNSYFQAPECVAQESTKIYQEEYQKLGVKTQMNPTPRSEACSLGYLIYTMVQGKKDIINFVYQKHKPLTYDNNFKSFKYSKQLQYIIDGLTKFIPRERLSVQEAFEKLNEIYSIEFNLDYKLQIEVSQQTYILSQDKLCGVEFIEKLDTKYYPIVKNEDSFFQELVSKKGCIKETIEKLLQIKNEKIEEKQDEIKGLKEKVETKSQDYENLKKNQQSHGGSSLFFQQQQEEKMEESEKKNFLENQVREQKIIQDLEDRIQDLEDSINSLIKCQCEIKGHCQKVCAECGHKFCGVINIWFWRQETNVYQKQKEEVIIL